MDFGAHSNSKHVRIVEDCLLDRHVERGSDASDPPCRLRRHRSMCPQERPYLARARRMRFRRSVHLPLRALNASSRVTIQDTRALHQPARRAAGARHGVEAFRLPSAGARHLNLRASCVNSYGPLKQSDDVLCWMHTNLQMAEAARGHAPCHFIRQWPFPRRHPPSPGCPGSWR